MRPPVAVAGTVSRAGPVTGAPVTGVAPKSSATGPRSSDQWPVSRAVEMMSPASANASPTRTGRRDDRLPMEKSSLR
ncbi:hypothetical protein L1856_04610 [Streptomyces sp. Tue 6430]|nr:hypothetical protein [Streptomyces sp. Tue 6430]